MHQLVFVIEDQRWCIGFIQCPKMFSDHLKNNVQSHLPQVNAFEFVVFNQDTLRSSMDSNALLLNNIVDHGT